MDKKPSCFGWFQKHQSRSCSTCVVYEGCIEVSAVKAETKLYRKTDWEPPVANHGHYFKSVANLDEIDVYRVLSLYGVTDPCLQHAVKKLLVAGGRGLKGADKDIQEAIDTLQRWQEMRIEDARGQL